MVTGVVEVALASQWQPLLVGLRMPQQAQLVTTSLVITAVVLKLFRVDIVAVSMVSFTPLEVAAFGGILQNILLQAQGSGICSSVAQVYS